MHELDEDAEVGEGSDPSSGGAAGVAARAFEPAPEGRT